LALSYTTVASSTGAFLVAPLVHLSLTILKKKKKKQNKTKMPKAKQSELEFAHGWPIGFLF
jgi:hypothetical protein